MIKTDKLVKSYEGKKAIDQVSMVVKKGSIYGLVGPNGAGKTTLIKLLAGIYKADAGYIAIKGEQPKENKHIKEAIYYMPDELHFDYGVRIKDLIKLYSRIYSSFDLKRAEKIMENLKFEESTVISKLSKGMKKQAAFMLGLSIKPDLMILDEPVDGLDPVVRKRIWSMILADVAEREMTVLISSHNLKELEGICDTVGILHHGKLILEKELDSMKDDLQKVQVAFKEVVDLRDIKALYSEQRGSLHTMIIRGSKAVVEASLARFEPKLLEFIPMSFEEIFMCEVGGAGDEIKDIIL